MTASPSPRGQWEEAVTALERALELGSGAVLDSSGQLRRRAMFDEQGNMLWYPVLTYYPDGKLHFTVSSEVIFGYDDQGRVTAMTVRQFLPRSVFESKYVSEYDDQGLQTKRSQYINGELGGWWEYVYNDMGKKIESLRYLPGSGLDTRTVYEYDEEGNEILEIWYDAQGNETRRISRGE